jgi:hypothetical protein
LPKAVGRQVHDVSAALLPVAGLSGVEGAYPEGYLSFGLGHQQGIFSVLVHRGRRHWIAAGHSDYLGAGRGAEIVHGDGAMKYVGRDLLR